MSTALSYSTVRPLARARLDEGRLNRDNNFDALRLVAATLVIVSHCWTLTGSVLDPVVVLTHGRLYAGEIGVWLFFAMSGYLVTESFVSRRSLVAFIEARALRIYPAFCVAIAFGIVVGALVTTLPPSAYFADTGTWRYLYRNLLFDIRFDLPGVFAHNPFPNAVNGSLWTLPLEASMYAVVAVLGVFMLLDHPRTCSVMLAGAVALVAVQLFASVHLPTLGSPLYALPAIAFLLGMLVQQNRARVPLRGAIVGALVAGGLLIGVLAPSLVTLYACASATYVTFFLAFHRTRARIPESIGDVSYGLYVYAFPVQQLLVWLYPAIGPWLLLALALPTTFVLAWFSWRLVEKPALALKGTIALPLPRTT